VVQALQLVAFATVLKLPPAHAAQVRSESASGAWVWTLPGAQLVQALQGVAGSRSWS
jgi:hypothetical protein